MAGGAVCVALCVAAFLGGNAHGAAAAAAGPQFALAASSQYTAEASEG